MEEKERARERILLSQRPGAKKAWLDYRIVEVVILSLSLSPWLDTNVPYKSLGISQTRKQALTSKRNTTWGGKFSISKMRKGKKKKRKSNVHLGNIPCLGYFFCFAPKKKKLTPFSLPELEWELVYLNVSPRRGLLMVS